MLEESICHFRGVGSILSLLFYFWWKTLLASNVDPDQTPHYVASDRGLHYFHVTLSRISRYIRMGQVPIVGVQGASS